MRKNKDNFNKNVPQVEDIFENADPKDFFD